MMERESSDNNIINNKKKRLLLRKELKNIAIRIFTLKDYSIIEPNIIDSNNMLFLIKNKK